MSRNTRHGASYIIRRISTADIVFGARTNSAGDNSSATVGLVSAIHVAASFRLANWIAIASHPGRSARRTTITETSRTVVIAPRAACCVSASGSGRCTMSVEEKGSVVGSTTAGREKHREDDQSFHFTLTQSLQHGKVRPPPKLYVLTGRC